MISGKTPNETGGAEPLLSVMRLDRSYGQPLSENYQDRRTVYPSPNDFNPVRETFNLESMLNEAMNICFDEDRDSFTGVASSLKCEVTSIAKHQADMFEKIRPMTQEENKHTLPTQV